MNIRGCANTDNKTKTVPLEEGDENHLCHFQLKMKHTVAV